LSRNPLNVKLNAIIILLMTEYITDLHFHSKYSRAVSKSMDLEHIAEWSIKKGIDVVTTADFTHPAWFSEIKEKLKLQKNGLFRLKQAKNGAHFMLTTEISCIYKKHDKVRRVHYMIIAPDFAAVKKINTQLDLIGNLKSDGRPILGLDGEKLVEIVMGASTEAMVFPAHIWTPWFSMFGSKSGFDTVEECFGPMTKHIYAVETGLSSDPPMNWRLSQLDQYSIVSFSDAHSPAKLGREATIFELSELSYHNILKAIKQQGGKKNKIAYTVEFHPEEGRYHWDGHRNCKINIPPQQSKKYKNICPKCKKPLTIGVLNRAEELADRPENYQPDKRPSYKSLVPLQEIIAESMSRGVNTKGVQGEYESLIKQGKNEFNILLNLTVKELKKIALPKIVEGIKKMRQGDLIVEPGYDGEYGIVKIFNQQEARTKVNGQSSLF